MDYSLEIEAAINSKVIVKEDIFDFRETPLERILSAYFNFCRENLNIHSSTEKIEPNLFVFTNSNEVNAKAILTSNKHFAITINLGLLRLCYANYHENYDLHKYFQKIDPATIGKFDNPINILAFQICIQFTYYHELAHLFQFKSRAKEALIQEQNYKKNTGGFDRLNHILEINADTYASISVATHIEQYIRKTFNDDLSRESTINTITVFCCCLLHYSIGLSENAEKIYFDEHTHPHSFIRLLGIILNIANHIEGSTYFNKHKIKIDSKELYLSVINTYKDIEEKKIFNTNVHGIIDQSKDIIGQITDYLYSISQFDTKDYENAMYVWNKHIP